MATEYIGIYLGVFLEGGGLMRRGMMEFANHPALHFSLPWFAIPPSACSSKTSSSSSSLSTRCFSVRVRRATLCDCVALARPRIPPLSSPHPIYLTSWYLFLVPLSSFVFLCLPIWRHISNVTSVPLQRHAIISVFFSFSLFICFTVRPRHLFTITPPRIPRSYHHRCPTNPHLSFPLSSQFRPDSRSLVLFSVTPATAYDILGSFTT